MRDLSNRPTKRARIEDRPDEASAVQSDLAINLKGYSDEEMRSIWEGLLAVVLGSLSAEQKANVPPVIFPGKRIENLSAYLEKEKGMNHGQRLLFVPLFVPYFYEGRFISVMLDINQNDELNSVTCIDSVQAELDIDVLIGEVKSAYSNFSGDVQIFQGVVLQADVDPQLSSIAAIENGALLLRKAILGLSYQIESTVSDLTMVLDIRRRHYGLSNEGSLGLAALKVLMENKEVDLDLETLSSVLQTSRSGFNAVVQSESRLGIFQAIELPFVAGRDHSFLSVSEDELYAIGVNEAGQLGLGHEEDQLSWSKVSLPRDVLVKRVITRVYHSFLITQSGELYACGSNREGQLGLRHEEDQNSWTKVVLPVGVVLKQVVLGLSHSFLITQSGELYACGFNEKGQLGLGHEENQNNWTKVVLPVGVVLKQVVVGLNHSFLITQSGELYACGDNNSGQLGLGDNDDKTSWTKVPLPDDVALHQVVAGEIDCSFLMTELGELYACGDDRFGQLGLGHRRNQNHWTKVPLPDDVALQQVISGATHSFLIMQSGELYACGNNVYGQLGLGHNDDKTSWTKVPLPDDVALQQVIAGGVHNFLMNQSGDFYACGYNEDGQLGLGDSENRNSWTRVALPEGFSFRLFAEFRESSIAVQKYLLAGASMESMQALVNALSAEQLLLVPYHLRAEQALHLNQLAYEALQDYPSVSAAASASGSTLVDQSIFSKLEDNGVDYSSFDPSENYLVMYKRMLGSDQAVVGSDTNDERFSAGRASPAA